ncbi:MAG: hypothetical protein HYV04_19790 [Deltaproteobacteria bacterium]|nr:hypothetical protein [Deltaproteobacteria bacterium]
MNTSNGEVGSLVRVEERASAYFVAWLTFRSWIGFVFPLLRSSKPLQKERWRTCFVFEASRAGWWIGKITAWLVRVQIKKFDYRLVDIHLPDGELAWLRVLYQDLAEVGEAVVQRWAGSRFGDCGKWNRHVEMFLRKQISTAVYRPLVMMRVALWRAMSGGGSKPCILLSPRLGVEELRRIGATNGADVGATSARWINAEMGRSLGGWCKSVLSRALAIARRLQSKARRTRAEIRLDPAGIELAGAVSRTANVNAAALPRKHPKIGVRYVGRFNLDDPGKFSDIFFWQCSDLAAEDITVMFDHPDDPLDEEKLLDLEKRGFGVIATHRRAISTPRADVHRVLPRISSPKARLRVFQGLEAACTFAEARWLRRQIASFGNMVHYYLGLFDATNVRVFVSYHKYDGNHAAIAEALQHLGGILAFYQRSFEPNPGPVLAVVTDVLFGWSRFGAEIERQSGSAIRYHVATGYLGDHRKSYVANRAGLLRSQLMNRGARRIVAFFDNNSLDDARWDTGHEFFQADYEYLLRQLLADPSVGVIFKAKTPLTVRKRLGSIADMLARAEMTGRCILLGSGPLQSTTAPIEAGLAADVTVGNLWSGSPSIECALGGVPSLLIDREGFPRSPLYRLGVGKVVFKDWDSLWQACEDHWRSPGGVPGFGDWSPMLEELDPFRDGRAAERMGAYLKWLIEGLKAGLGRETVMADAAERYCAQWGKDKVTEVNGRSLWSPPSGSDGSNHSSDRQRQGGHAPGDQVAFSAFHSQ